MQEILDLTAVLSNRIKSSATYENYYAALHKIEANPDLKERIKEFKKIQMQYNFQEALSLDQEKHVSKLYFDLCLNSDAKQFLEYEKKMLTLILRVQESLWADCNMELVLE